MRKRNFFWIAPLALTALAAFVTLGGLLTQRLWNWLAPTLFGWHVISFWQALGLLLLCRILFGSFGFHNNARSNARARLRERLGRLSPEERERMRARCGFDPPAGANAEQP